MIFFRTRKSVPEYLPNMTKASYYPVLFSEKISKQYAHIILGIKYSRPVDYLIQEICLLDFRTDVWEFVEEFIYDSIELFSVREIISVVSKCD